MVTSINSRRPYSQFDSSLPPPKPPAFPVRERFDLFREKYCLGEVDYTTFSLSYTHLPPSNSAFKHTTSSLDNLLDTSSETTIPQPLHRRYNLRSNRNFSSSLASTNSSLVRHHA